MVKKSFGLAPRVDIIWVHARTVTVLGKGISYHWSFVEHCKFRVDSQLQNLCFLSMQTQSPSEKTKVK